MPRLMSQKAEWDRLLNVPLRIEGRLASQGTTLLRFAKCDLSFHLTEDLARQIGRAKNVEVQGRIVRDKESGKLRFDVVYVKPLPSDRDEFLSREAALKHPKASDWYELAQWADQRGRFYEDAALQESARSCQTKGLAVEVSALLKEDSEGRFKLAEKARELQLSDHIADELHHEAYRAWWTRATAVGKPAAEDLAALSKRVSAEWPAATTALPAWPAELFERYTKDPHGTYRQADEAQRLLLQRMFVAQVQLRQITALATTDGQNAGEIADQIEQLVPERKSLAETYREQDLRYRQSKLPTATKSEAVLLADAFRQRGRADQATDTLRQWLSARRQRIAQHGGAPEFLTLADDTWTLLKDERATVELLEIAREREPDSEDVQARFRELGYEWNGTRWLKSIPTAPAVTTAPEAIGPNGLREGLSSTQVRQLQGGPQHVARLISLGGVDEFWTYGEGTGSRLVVQFQRRLHETELKVVRVYQR
jgi:hypothetical protein